MDETKREISEEELKALDIAKLNSDAAFKLYSLEFQRAMSNCQYIEEMLKHYLSVTYRRIQERLKPDLHFKYEERDFEKDSMGKLISKYERLSDDAEMARRLRHIVEDRNHYAHKGFLFDFGKITAEELDSMIGALTEFRDKTKGLLMDLFKIVGALPIEGEEMAQPIHQSKGQS